MTSLAKIATSIRVLVMDKKNEFGNISIQEVQNNFFSNELKHREDCYYHFKIRRMKDCIDNLILHQYDNRIVAHSQLKDVIINDPPIKGIYHGTYFFYKDTIHLVEPIEVSEINKIVPVINRFSNSDRIIDISKFDEILKLLVSKTI